MNNNDNNKLETGCDVTELFEGGNTPVIGESYYVVFLVECNGSIKIDTTELILKYWEPGQAYDTKDKLKIFSSLIKSQLKVKPSKLIILNFMRL